MADQVDNTTNWVGPVLRVGMVADAVIAAIKQRHTAVVVLDRQIYCRVLVPGRCVVTRAGIEAHLGRAVSLPDDLAKVLLAFQGQFAVSEECATWTS